MKKIVSIVLVCAGMLGGSFAGAQDLVQFKNGESITSADLTKYLETRVDLRSVARNVWGVESVLKEMALTRALVQEGLVIAEPNEEGGAPARFDDKYALKVFRRLSPLCEPPQDQAAVRQFFEATPQAFRVPAMARLSRVMLPVGTEVDGLGAGGWLMSQVQEIGAGKRSFDDVAKRAEVLHKLDPQGDIGWVTLAEENSILKALSGAGQGDLVGPVREGDFVYLFSIRNKREARQLAWEDVAASASSRAVSYCRQTAADQLKTHLLDKYGATVNGLAVKALFDKSKP